jgi:hypothetical protein
MLVDHAEPFQCISDSAALPRKYPHIHTSFGPLPQRARVPDRLASVAFVHVDPFQ